MGQVTLELADVIDGDVISNSESGTFRRCRRKWMLQYYRRLGHPEDKFPPTGAMHIGIAIHDAMEAYYGHGESPIQVLRDIYNWHIKRWEDDPDAVIEIAKDRDMAIIMVEGYLDWASLEGIDAEIEITGAEEIMTADMPNGYTLLGKLDVTGVNKENGFKFFIDHKTVGDLVRPAKQMELNEQYPTYALLQRLNVGASRAVDGGYVNMLRRVKRTVQAKPPFYKRADVKFNEHQLRSMHRKIRGVISEIIEVRRRLDAGEDHHIVAYPTPNADCDWDCPFRDVCPLMDDGSRYEDMLNKEFVEITNPYSRYTDEPLRKRARDGLRQANEPDTVG